MSLPDWPAEQPTWPLGDLLLRPWTAADRDQIVAACRDPDIVRFTRVPHPYSPADADWFVASRPQEWQQRTGAGCALVPAGRPDHVLASIGIVGLDATDRVGEIGYWTAPAHRRRGNTARGVRRLAEVFLTELGLDRIELLAEVANDGSQAVARRAGFRHEGVLRSRMLQRGERRDAHLFSLITRDLAPGLSR